MANIMLLVKLSENEKRIIIALLLLIIITFVLIGLFVAFIRRLMVRYGRGIDTYLAEMLQYQVLTKPREVRRYVNKRETRTLVKKLLIPTGVFVGLTIGFVIYAAVANVTVSHFFDVLGGLFPTYKWPMTYFFGLHIPNDWPSIAQGPRFDISSAYVYIFAVACLVYGWILIRRTMIYLARMSRASKMSQKVFSKDLDQMHFESR